MTKYLGISYIRVKLTDVQVSLFHTCIEMRHLISPECANDFVSFINTCTFNAMLIDDGSSALFNFSSRLVAYTC